MRAGDKAADLGSRREGTIPILESRPTAAVSWRRLRASQSAFGKRSRPGEKDPLPQPARRRQGATPAEWILGGSHILGFAGHILRFCPPACDITALYYKKVLLYEQRTL